MPRSRLLLLVSLATALYWVALFVSTHIPVRAQALRQATGLRLDKIGHLLAFAVLAILLATVGRLRGASIRRASALALAAIALYGLFDEATQQFIPSRSFDWLDWLADLLGAGIGVSLFQLLAGALADLRRRPGA